MALRLIPHIDRATHRIALYIDELDDPKLKSGGGARAGVPRVG